MVSNHQTKPHGYAWAGGAVVDHKTRDLKILNSDWSTPAHPGAIVHPFSLFRS